VLALGPDVSFYGAALGEKKTADSAFLRHLSDREIDNLFTFVPQAYQVTLERLSPQNATVSQNVPWGNRPARKKTPSHSNLEDDGGDRGGGLLFCGIG
jgi:hypothetical protein